MPNNYELQQYFLDYIKREANGGPIDKNFVYKRIIGFNVKNDQGPYQQIDNMFPDWIERYKGNKDIKCLYEKDDPYFLWFLKGRMKGNEVKLYIPLDINHIKEGGNQLFDFISNIGIEHQSKIASKIRNDNLVVRVNNIEDAKRVIDFAINNPYIQEGLIKTNPFVANYNGVGMTMDNSYSYNSTICQMISDFYNYLRQRNLLDVFNVKQLNVFITKQIPRVQNPDLRDIYSLASKVTTPNFKIEDFLEHAEAKSTDLYTEGRKRIEDEELYLESLIEQNESYYPKNSSYALLMYIKNNATGFTRRDNIRKSMLRHVSPGNLIPIMRKRVSDFGLKIPQTDEELVNVYLMIIKNNKKEIENDDPFEVVKNAYLNTLALYGSVQARAALNALLTNGDIQYFTNKKGDRDKLKKYKDKNIKKILLTYIDIDNLDTSDILEIVNRFEQAINTDTKKEQKER